ncbi:Na(+)/H(+) antiporter subunit D [Mesorhizobium sp. M1C.F.Ca.ET.193.01.1.1]|uniref:Na(+)/H(+) antiporter subunit D n=2 Tax=Mesorhizobium TaxID=68287 RepID=UPI000FD4CA64|nr:MULTISPECIES: Na(+)/H(+) antiporter subunit D [unclassified Mesorhizobium]TGT00043.1 Na(+)/H(+) antiporter subunit D [bacterium M00.F.Ca.ET.177.01.1.1]TGQ53439.1 Na(+)/H(+) antiporter subunit D [Mesorhizobium sp. M1C.F.Ca.ET.210.01.1.1]TGQ70706.1 Na(+)/H(+) antiporter subunit D [Mesorhizobium sp. M1C.F.Ca.ET.212.01.1.1]TGR07279.1 Na(+)/H(+) antiporter subunit D [Mesorhizobium sp. M1C.F.Ca.ET.204.01.1.1]TGR28153.1 Na(+)/H(+) antiporter subunit D [Mesorhizobium sp. M1C.F.Ca.ET.196.01.1.1]
MTDFVHPGLMFILGALPIPFLKRSVRKAYVLLIPTLAILAVLTMHPGAYGTAQFIGQQIIVAKVDKLSILFATVFSIMALIGTVYALHLTRAGQHVAAFVYVGSALGVVFAGDYLTLFLFWEGMTFASAYLVFAQRSDPAFRAGFRYLMVHVTGGVALLGGIILRGFATGSLLFGPVEGGLDFATCLILAGFLLNAAVPPLNAWLTDAYPEATVTGAVFMSAFTTKTAVYVLARAFPGTDLLVWLGTVMALYGVIYAVLENDCRRLLAYHIVSQVGYMVAGIGIGTEMAVNGAVSHAFAHILYKALLFMGAGAVIHVTGRRKLTELGGLYKTMPVTVALYMVGAFAISAFPFFSGFVTKSMVVAAAGQDHRALVVLALTMASSGTFLHTGLKLPYYMFFGKDQGLEAREPPRNMLVAMGMAAVLCIAIGVFPQMLYALLPHPVDFEPYTAVHITESLGVLMFTALGFVMFLKALEPENKISIDTDWFYRMGARHFMWLAERPLARYEKAVSDVSETAALPFLHGAARAGLRIDLHGVDALVNGFARTILRGGGLLRRLQSGVVTHYALAMIAGVIAAIAVFAVAWQ